MEKLIVFLVIYYVITVAGMYELQVANDDDVLRCLLFAATWPVWLPVMGFFSFLRRS